MAWCHQATSHYLSQSSPSSMSPYVVTRPQWVKALHNMRLADCFLWLCLVMEILKIFYSHNSICPYSSWLLHWELTSAKSQQNSTSANCFRNSRYVLYIDYYIAVWVDPCTLLIHWGRVTHICVSKIIIIGSNNGLLPDRRQAIIWTNAGLLSIGPLRTYFNENLIKIQQFSLTKMHVKMSSAKWCPSCLGLNVLSVADVIHQSLQMTFQHARSGDLLLVLNWKK